MSDTDDIIRQLEAHWKRVPKNNLNENGVLAAYLAALGSLGSVYADRFRPSAEQATPGAIAEAATWQILRQLGCFVLRFERLDQGGPDFVARLPTQDVLVEATSLEDGTLQNTTGLRREAWGEMQFLGSAIPAFRNRIRSKVPQIGGAQFAGPRVLTVAYRSGNGAHSPCHVANEIIAEATAVQVTIGGGLDSARMVTRLDSSAWYRPASGSEAGFAPTRESISAVLLMELRNDHVWLAGSLNPHALHPLDPRSFPLVPWTVVTNDPLQDGTFYVRRDWHDDSHRPILTGEDHCELWFDGHAPHPGLGDYHANG